MISFLDGPFMLLIFAGVGALCLAFLELFVYALLRSKRSNFCLPSGGPTNSRGGKTCSIIKEELTNVISRNETKRKSQQQLTAGNGITTSAVVSSPRVHRFGANQNGGTTATDILKTNGGLKNGGHHNFYQTQALLRKDVHKDENNAHL